MRPRYIFEFIKQRPLPRSGSRLSATPAPQAALATPLTPHLPQVCDAIARASREGNSIRLHGAKACSWNQGSVKPDLIDDLGV